AAVTILPVHSRLVKHVLFVCTGNICRSPMAEGIFRAAVKGQRDIEVSSAGVAAMLGDPPSRHAVEVLRPWGIDIAGQRSRPLTDEIVREASHIFVMTRGHKEAIEMYFPEAASKTHLFR